MSDLVDLSTEVGACPVERGVLAVVGPDAEAFLQGQLSQDVAALGIGSSAWSLILQPQGRVDGFVRVSRRADDDFVLDTDGPLDPLVARLRRFMLRTDVTLTPLEWLCISVRGLGAADVDVAGEVVGSVPTGGIDVLGAAPVVADHVVQVSPEILEVDRIRSGFPRMGADIGESTIPAEAEVVPWTVSFTKGCFTGQELVARMDSRGSNAPRYLRLLTIAGSVTVAAGDPIADLDGNEVGVLTSVAWDATANETVALGYIKRSVEMPSPVQIAGYPGEAVVVPR